ncbi:MAG: hypothetical protein OSB58_21610, partial [Alphaproteobacteria bacterium]|nr:hypothetical protein [Alphaproteobacteria bacterium]
GIHLNNAAKLSNKVGPPQGLPREWVKSPVITPFGSGSAKSGTLSPTSKTKGSGPICGDEFNGQFPNKLR